MPRLLVEKGPDRGKSVSITTGGQLIVGRDPSANLQLTDHMCSRRHVLIASKGAVFGMKDLGSANGTLVNGRRMNTAHRLEYGDTIQIGETLISWLPSDETDRQGGLVGHVVGGYRIEQRLGRGAMGTVYKATQLSLGRTVALKVLSPELTKDQRFCDMFLKEARAAGGLNHPNIIQVYDVGDENGQYYFSMEFAARGSVLEELGKQRSLPLPRALEVMRHACAALDYAERKGLVHRDIKPDNLMVMEDGMAKLGDLGLAMSAHEINAEQDGVFGTPHYIAPEQAMGKPIDHRADIYALGASFYRMITGRTMFEGATVKEILRQQVRDPHPPVTNWLPDCPRGVSAVIDRMLAKNPAERYQHAADVAHDLALVESMSGRPRGAPALAERPRGLDAEQAGVLRASLSRRNLVLATLAAVVALVGLGAVLYFTVLKPGDNGTPTPPPVAKGNTPPVNNAPVDPAVPPETREADEKLREAILMADLEVGAPDAGRDKYENAVKRITDAQALWINASPEMRDRARKRRAELEAIVDELSTGLQQVRSEWELTRQTASADAAAFKIKAAGEKLADFLAKHTESENAEVRQVLAQAQNYVTNDWPREVAKGLTTWLDGVRRERDRAQANAVPAERVTALESLLERVTTAAEACDDDAARTQIMAWDKDLRAAIATAKQDAERARLEAVQAAQHRASASLDALLAEAASAVAQGRFAESNALLDAWQKENADFAAHSAEPAFAGLRDDLQRRRDQTALIVSALRAMAAAMPGVLDMDNVLRETAWPEDVAAELGGPRVVFEFAMPDASAPDQAWRVTRFAGTRNLGTWRAGDAPQSARKAIAGALVHLLARHERFRAALLRPAPGSTVPVAVGVFAWLMELGCTGTAPAFVEAAYGQDLPAEARPLVREYYAWGLLARARAAAEAGNREDAAALMARLESEFADTRANQGRK